MRVRFFLAAAFAAALLGGCAGSPQSPAGGAAAVPQSVVLDARPMSGMDAMTGTMDAMRPAKKPRTFTVGLKTNNENYYSDKTYGQIFGIFKGLKAKSARVVVIHAGDNVVFQNPDTLPHTGSLLGDATKDGAPWPSSFDGGQTASSPGTDISTSGFSTGIVSPGKTSATYTAKVPGFYMFGCGIHYTSLMQRNIIIVQ